MYGSDFHLYFFEEPSDILSATLTFRFVIFFVSHITAPRTTHPKEANNIYFLWLFCPFRSFSGFLNISFTKGLKPEVNLGFGTQRVPKMYSQLYICTWREAWSDGKWMMLTKCKNDFPIISRMRMSKFWCPIGRCRYWRVNLLIICIFAKNEGNIQWYPKETKKCAKPLIFVLIWLNHLYRPFQCSPFKFWKHER